MLFQFLVPSESLGQIETREYCLLLGTSEDFKEAIIPMCCIVVLCSIS